MAEIEQEPKRDTKDLRARRKIGSKTKGKTGKKKAGTKKKAAEKALGSQDAAVENGAELLKRAAGSVVGRNSEKIAMLLLEKTMAGDLNSAKLLVTLAERQKPGGEPATKPVREEGHPTQAELWAAEPQWQEGDPEYKWEDEEEEGGEG